MRKVNAESVEELTWTSPKGAFTCGGKQISEALGRDPTSSDALLRHPFDVEILRVPAGAVPYPYHSHSAQWEFYHVMSGSGSVRHADGETPVVSGDAFIFKPGEAHQLRNDADQDMVVLVVADNPIGESTHYPDSGKFAVRSPESRILGGAALDYFDGEE